MGGDTGLDPTAGAGSEGGQARVPRGSLRLAALPEVQDCLEWPWHRASFSSLSPWSLAGRGPVLTLLGPTLQSEI